MTISPNPTEPYHAWCKERGASVLRKTAASENAFHAGWTSRDRTAQETADRLLEAEKALLPFADVLDRNSWLANYKDTDLLTLSVAAGDYRRARAYFASHPQNQGKETP